AGSEGPPGGNGPGRRRRWGAGRGGGRPRRRRASRAAAPPPPEAARRNGPPPRRTPPRLPSPPAPSADDPYPWPHPVIRTSRRNGWERCQRRRRAAPSPSEAPVRGAGQPGALAEDAGGAGPAVDPAPVVANQEAKRRAPRAGVVPLAVGSGRGSEPLDANGGAGANLLEDGGIAGDAAEDVDGAG